MSNNAVVSAVDGLLKALFDVDELRRFVLRFYGRGVADALPGQQATANRVFLEACQLFIRHGVLADNSPPTIEFFVTLLGLRPAFDSQTRAVARLFGLDDLPQDVPRLHLRNIDASGHGVRSVFISYSHDDAAWALATERALMHADIRVVRDVHEFKAGEDLEPRILDALSSVDRVVCGWSANSARSPWVGQEIRLSRKMMLDEELARFLVIEKLDATPLPEDLKELLHVDSSFLHTGDLAGRVAALESGDRRMIMALIDRFERK